jgi:hypothetical protein
MDNARILVRTVRRLHELWQSTEDRDVRFDIGIAANLAAHAALDALLPGQSRGHRVRDSWRDGSVLARAAHLTARLDEPLPPDLETLCAVRHALGRSVDGAYAPEVHSWLAGDGLARSIQLLAHFERLGASRRTHDRTAARALHAGQDRDRLVGEHDT